MKTYETFNFTNRYLFFINIIQFIQKKILIYLHIKHNKNACNYKLLYLFDLTFQIIFIKSSCLGESQLPYSIFISILRCLSIACITRDMLCYSMSGTRKWNPKQQIVLYIRIESSNNLFLSDKEWDGYFQNLSICFQLILILADKIKLQNISNNLFRGNVIQGH